MRKNKNGQLCFFPCAIPNRSNFVLFCMASRSEKFVFFGGTEGKIDRKKKGGEGETVGTIGSYGVVITHTHTCM